LGDSQGFEVLIWKQGQEHLGAASAVDGSFREISINVANAKNVSDAGTGDYFWTVVVVQLNPYARIGEEAAPRTIKVSVPKPNGSSNDGGGAPP
jgi:hypothetical protein